MVSGRYSALSGAVARQQNLDNIAANLANVSTVGYKRAEINFESILKGSQQITRAHGINYTRIKENYTDFSDGPIDKTGAPLDLAIHGKGFFKVEGPNGTLYTRKGNFTLNANGDLVTSAGMRVLDDANAPITIPSTDINKITINSLGAIYIVDNSGNQTQAGTIAVVDITDKTKLKREADTTFSLQPGGREVPIDQPQVVQGALESSNVNMVVEMTRMINNERDFDTYNKVLKSYAAIDAKDDSLGTLS